MHFPLCVICTVYCTWYIANPGTCGLYMLHGGSTPRWILQATARYTHKLLENTFTNSISIVLCNDNPREILLSTLTKAFGAFCTWPQLGRNDVCDCLCCCTMLCVCVFVCHSAAHLMHRWRLKIYSIYERRNADTITLRLDRHIEMINPWAYCSGFVCLRFTRQGWWAVVNDETTTTTTGAISSSPSPFSFVISIKFWIDPSRTAPLKKSCCCCSTVTRSLFEFLFVYRTSDLHERRCVCTCAICHLACR